MLGALMDIVGHLVMDGIATTAFAKTTPKSIKIVLQFLISAVVWIPFSLLLYKGIVADKRFLIALSFIYLTIMTVWILYKIRKSKSQK